MPSKLALFPRFPSFIGQVAPAASGHPGLSALTWKKEASCPQPEGYFEDKGGIERKARRQQALLAGGRCGLSACVGLGGGSLEPQAWLP